MSSDTEQACCWRIIERARKGSADFEQTATRVHELLLASSADEIAAFQRGRVRLLERSYTWALWGAAYVINGGCSDDGFDYFRGWLLTQGHDVFEAALVNPDSLAELVDEEVECEEILYVDREAYLEVAGKELEGAPMRLPELGEGWDFDDVVEMKRRYPKLWEKFGYES